MVQSQGVDAVPWAPEDLPVAPGRLRSWTYVVLEELVDGVCLLRRWSWPVADPLGRLSWPDGSELSDGAVTIGIDRLRAQLYLPNDIARVPRVGDVFAVERTPGRWAGARVTDLSRVLDGRIYDVTADARLAAKIAYQSGLAAVRPSAREDEQLVAAARANLRAQSSARLRPLRIRAELQ